MPGEALTLERVIETEYASSPQTIAPKLEWLLDNADAYDAVVDCIRSARESIRISQLAFDADCIAFGTGSASNVRLLDALLQATTEHNVDVRILINESLLLDTATPLRRAIAAAGGTRITVRGISRFPQLLHAKFIIVDQCYAILLGSPFVNGYGDDARHVPEDARRPARELGGRPLHDLSIGVEGHVVDDLAALFDAWWNEVAKQASENEPQAFSFPDACDSSGVRVVCTAPELARTPRSGRTEILSALERGIARARSLLYIEHQYLSSRRIASALTSALRRAPELEIVVLLNQNPDVTAYRGWQNQRFHEHGLLDHPRVGLFGLWSASADERSEGGTALTQVFVHSKVLIADDQWATIGTANLDGVSLHSYGADFKSWIGERVFRDVRNFDVNLELDGDEPSVREAIARLRTALWAEHLGEYSIAGRTPLSMWRSLALANVAALRATQAPRGSFILPYSTEATPAGQLDSMGIALGGGLRLTFEPSWLEVHCSPNWIRNMFA